MSIRNEACKCLKSVVCKHLGVGSLHAIKLTILLSDIYSHSYSEGYKHLNFKEKISISVRVHCMIQNGVNATDNRRRRKQANEI